MTPDLLGELPALLVSNVARGCADEPRHAVFLHVFAHVDADHQLLIVEEKLRERSRQFGFPHAGGAQENERTDGPLGVGESCAAAPHGVRHALECVVLADHPQPQPLFHVHQLLCLGFQQSAGRNARPLAHQFRDVFLIDFFLQHGRVLLHRSEPFLRLLQVTLRRGYLSVADLRHFRELAGAFILLFFRP